MTEESSSRRGSERNTAFVHSKSFVNSKRPREQERNYSTNSFSLHQPTHSHASSSSSSRSPWHDPEVMFNPPLMASTVEIKIVNAAKETQEGGEQELKPATASESTSESTTSNTSTSHVTIVRDDAMEGGTFCRAWQAIATTTAREIVFPASRCDPAIIAFSRLAHYYHLRLTIFVTRKEVRGDLTQEAHDEYGAKIETCSSRATLAELQHAASDYARNSRRDVLFLPLGFDSPVILQALTDGIARSLSPRRTIVFFNAEHPPKRIFVVWLSSNVLANALRSLYGPTPELMLVQVGNALHHIPHHSQVLVAKERFDEAAQQLPPFPCSFQGAKIWQFAHLFTSDDLVWNT